MRRAWVSVRLLLTLLGLLLGSTLRWKEGVWFVKEESLLDLIALAHVCKDSIFMDQIDSLFVKGRRCYQLFVLFWIDSTAGIAWFWFQYLSMVCTYRLTVYERQGDYIFRGVLYDEMAIHTVAHVASRYQPI